MREGWLGVHQTADLDDALAVARGHLEKGEDVRIRLVEFYSPGTGEASDTGGRCEHEAREFQVEAWCEF